VLRRTVQEFYALFGRGAVLAEARRAYHCLRMEDYEEPARAEIRSEKNK
jgi:hypothetical protein